MPRIQTRRPGGTQISEVASAGESLGGLWPRSLIDGEPLRLGVRYLHTAPVGDLEIHADLDLAAAELRDCPIETLDAVDEDWLIAREMPGEQERGRIRGQPHHRHPCAEGLNREYDLRGQDQQHRPCLVAAVPGAPRSWHANCGEEGDEVLWHRRGAVASFLTSPP